MKIGFIGCGNMASAIIGGILKNRIAEKEDILASDAYAPSLEKARKNLGIAVTADNRVTAAKSDVLFLSVKPQYYETVSYTHLTLPTKA